MCKKNYKHFIVLVMSLIFCVVSNNMLAADNPAAIKQKTYIFHMALDSPIKEILEARIQEAFRRLNLKAELSISPSSQRALMLANEDGDGDAARVANLKELAPQHTTNLILVPESIITIKMSVYSKNLSFPVEGWNSLTKYHNGARIGAKFLEKDLPGKRTFLPRTVQLVQMLDSNRIDTMLEWNLIADRTIQKLNLTGINKLSPPIKTMTLYVYVHKEHQALVPQLTKILGQMKKDGTFDKVRKDILQ